MPDPVEETKPEDAPVDILDVSDEDFLKMEEPGTPEPIEEDLGEDNGQAEDETKDGEQDNPPADPNKKEDAAVTPEPVTELEPKKEDTTVIPDGSGDKEIPPVVDEGEPKKEKSTPDIDYKAEYEKVMAPFKANGKDMTAKSAEDAVTLMQMGANYHKKMAGLKPSLKTLKLLEKNDLLDPDKLNYLIDLNNKNPEAITKLLKDSGIDPLDVDVKTDSTYKPTNRSVTDTELDLDEVLESIKDTPTYSKTLNVMTKDWDDASKNAVANQPHIISIINGHIADGTYDTVMGAVAYERSLGKLQGVPDLEAYKQTGDALHAAGKLGSPAQTAPPASADVTPPAKPGPSEEEIKRRERKKAASPTKTTATAPAKPFNPLDLSDEEFEKFDPKRFIKR